MMRPWSFVSLLFEVKGRVAGTTKVIRLTTNGKFGVGGDLEEALKRMGWVNQHVKSTLDEDGLEVDSMGDAEEDEDGLGVVNDDLASLTQMSFEDFVDATKGQKFWLKVSKDSKGFYRIEPDSLAPKG
ncbi:MULTISPECIES: hypothetical protein [unclassified Microcoleus]|uniref:hypothetical protein n=1 Tax=unclassified Microcoleus TaxID=2642155 RepID=UPI002FD0B07D